MFTSYFNRKLRHALLCISVPAFVYPNGFDNRYFPFTSQWNSPRTTCKPSHLYTSLSMYVANRAFQDDEEDTTIPHIYGPFNEQNLAKAYALKTGSGTTLIQDAVVAGTLPAGTDAIDLLWHLEGKITGQALNFNYEQHLFNHLSIGFAGAYMHIFSRQSFEPTARLVDRFTPDQLLELDQIRRTIQQQVGLEAAEWSHSGFSDIDLYLRYGRVWDYVVKCRRIDLGVRFGMLVPSGVKRHINNPASIPFGGNGLTGMYGAFDGEFELKEDWIVGYLFQFEQRFSKKRPERLPLALEHPLYGVDKGDVHVQTDMTLIFAPYVRLDNLQDGLGLQVRYWLISHGGDFMSDPLLQTRTPRVTLSQLNKAQKWCAEVVSATLLYDFGAVRNDYDFAPTFIVTWDIPVKIFAAERSSATNRISCGFNVTF